MTFHIRTTLDLGSLTRFLRQAVESEAPGLPLFDVKTMDAQLSFALLPARAAALTLSAFGVICMLLLSVGIHSVVTLTVIRRTREVGIRVALGASPGSATRAVIWEEARVVLVGLPVGLVGALGAGGAIQGILYSGHGLDAPVILGAPVILAAVAAAATWVPARRAARIDPGQALREP